MISIKKFLVIVSVFAISALSVQPALAAGPKPGNGWGDKKHIHIGPPGHSVRLDNRLNISPSITILAGAGAHIVVNIINNITQIFNIGS